MAVSIALVEDNAVNKNTFLQKMQLYNDIDIKFTADNGDIFLERIKNMPFSFLPQVVFMDVEMPGIDGVQTIQIAKALYPNIYFIVLTVFDDEEKIFEAIKAGASGYLLKDEKAESIKNAITNVIEFGGAPMSPAIARKVLQLLGSGKTLQHQSGEDELSDYLSGREIEILHHIVRGYDAKKIADMLSISILTVRKHIANIYQRLHVNSKAQIINLAHKRKWV